VVQAAEQWDGELLAQGEVFESQSGAVLEEGVKEQEDDAEHGHGWLHLGKLADSSG